MYVTERFSLKPLIRGASGSQNMVQRSTLLMIGLGFTLGLTVGLLLQLPGVSSPGHARGRRDVSRGDNEHTGAVSPVLSATLEQRRQTGEEEEKGETSKNFNSTDLKSSGQTGHVPKIPSANIPSQHGQAVKPVPKQTSGQNHAKKSVSVLQVRIRQTKDTIENIKKQHGWNSSKSHGKQADKKPASISSHRDAAGKTPAISSSRSKTKTVSIPGDEKSLGSRTVSSLVNPHTENKRNISLNLDNLDNLQHRDNLQSSSSDSISVSNELENDGLSFAADSVNSEKDKSSNGNHDSSTTKMKQSQSRISGYNLFNGIYWSKEAEMMAPESITEEETKAWRSKVNTQTIAAMKQGCGRQQNRLVQLSDGSMACARYRINKDQIQGEVFSYYLARLLGIQNVPPPVLALPDPSDPRWSPVLDQLISAQWNSDRALVLTPWIDNLNPVFIPDELRPASRRLHPDPELKKNRNFQEIGELVQWSDLIILDYLTANVDRAVNNLYNLQWNSDMMSAPAHNLEKVGKNGPLIFLDNESGLFHSYRLLDKYSEYQESFLKSLCVFRESTATAVKTLAKDGQIGNKLAGIFTQEESLHGHLPLPRATNTAILQTRLQNVLNQIDYCDKLYKNNQI